MAPPLVAPLVVTPRNPLNKWSDPRLGLFSLHCSRIVFPEWVIETQRRLHFLMQHAPREMGVSRFASSIRETVSVAVSPSIHHDELAECEGRVNDKSTWGISVMGNCLSSFRAVSY